MSDLHDRFERLARRGTLRGADVVLTEARRLADDSGAIVGVDEPAPGDDTRSVVSPINLEPVSIARKQRRFGALVTAGGVAASLFVGVLAIGSITGSGGGANSPEGAVRQLADAVSHEDALAAADVLAPEEVRSLQGTVDAASKRAQELALAESASAPLTGLDLSVDGLALSTESLGRRLRQGHGGGRHDLGSHRQGAFLAAHAAGAAQLGRQPGAGQPRDAGPGREPPDVRRDRAARRALVRERRVHDARVHPGEANHLPAADFGSGQRAIATLGADSPDAAVTDAMQALAHSDWQKLISLAPPDELPVYDYRAALTQLAADSPTELHDRQARHDVDGERRHRQGGAEGLGSHSSRLGRGFGHVVGRRLVLPVPESRHRSTSYGGYPVEHDVDRHHDVRVGRSRSSPTFGDAGGNGSSAAITVVRKEWPVVRQPGRHRARSRRRGHSQPHPPDPLHAAERARPAAARRRAHARPTGDAAAIRLRTLRVHVRGSPGVSGCWGFRDRPGCEQRLPQRVDAEVRIFAPDGTELDDSYGLLDGQAVQLPADGKYTFTFFRLLRQRPDGDDLGRGGRTGRGEAPAVPGPIGECTPSTDGRGVPCTIDRGSTTATTFPRSSSASSTSVPGG